MHKPQDILITELKAASSKVKIGGHYRHYKNPDKTYKLLLIAFTESDDALCVIYEAQYGERLVFVRPVDSWLGKVEWEDKIVNRFTLIN